ncbi:helix-turn-helix domain-containing protein [Streptomyces milbemycinicus]|uniref:Helix-turn-helix domain-containing protein n=1 Tax=Streptomyces milbemycinicus TaxID=476552 RepID=A0ABW8M5I4_9ACTN
MARRRRGPAACGRSYAFAHRVLTEAGITISARGGPNARRHSAR